MDNCPTCGKRIYDFDEEGCEAPSGQRYCREHVPADVHEEMMAESAERRTLATHPAGDN
jgi:hypothetical protein